MPIQARWLIPEGNAQEAEALAAALGIRLPAARVLLARELGDPDAARRFLQPSLADLHPPGSLRGMSEAVERLRRAEEHTSELQSRQYLVCRLLLEKKKNM